MQNREGRDDKVRRRMQGEAQLAVQLRRHAGERGEVERCRVAGDVRLIDGPLETSHVWQVLEIARRRVVAEEFREICAVAVDIAAGRGMAANEIVGRRVEER